MQVADLVGPPDDGHPAPLGYDGRMMILCFGQGTELIGKEKGRCEALEMEDPLEARNSIALDHTPVWNLGEEFRVLTRGNGGCIQPAGGALHAGKIRHHRSIPRCERSGNCFHVDGRPVGGGTNPGQEASPTAAEAVFILSERGNF